MIALKEGLDLCADVEIISQLLGQVGEGTVDEDMLRGGSHVIVRADTSRVASLPSASMKSDIASIL